MKWETRIDDSLVKIKAEYDAGVPCSSSKMNGTYGARRIDSWSPPESMLLNCGFGLNFPVLRRDST